MISHEEAKREMTHNNSWGHFWTGCMISSGVLAILALLLGKPLTPLNLAIYSLASAALALWYWLLSAQHRAQLPPPPFMLLEDEEARRCANTTCGHTFIVFGQDRGWKYCSDSCRKQEQRRRYDARRRQPVDALPVQPSEEQKP